MSATGTPSPPRPDDAARTARGRRRRWLRRVAVGAGILVVLVAATAAWLVGTTAGARFAVARATGLTDGAFTAQRVDGRLLGPLALSDVRYADAATGLDVRIASARIDLDGAALLAGRLHARSVTADGVTIGLPTAPSADTPSTGAPPQAPFDIVLDQARIAALRIERGTDALFAANRVDVGGSWTHAGVTLRALDIQAADGEAHVAGTLDPAHGYRGSVDARVAWRLGQATYAGTLAFRGDGSRARLTAGLQQPARAELAIDAALGGRHPWTASVSAPRFDPAAFGIDSPVSSAALALKARGEGSAGTLDGTLGLDGYTLAIAPLAARFHADPAAIELPQLTVTSPQIPGRLEAHGRVELAQDPVEAELTLAWQDVILPPALVGQKLASSGTLDLAGSAAAYHAQGKLRLGAPGRTGEFTFAASGTPRDVAVHELHWTQAGGGRLDASGRLTLQPAFGWDIEARAQRLDPGEAFAAWRGRLTFDLTSTGQQTPQGPDARLDLRELSGTLRGHVLRGAGQLQLAPDQVLSGRLDLASEHGSARLLGQRGTANRIELTLDHVAPGDWWSGASGRVDGHFLIAGRWPRLSINGQARAQDLDWQGQRVTGAHLIVGVPDATRPAGKIQLTAQGVHTGGLVFPHITALAEGSERDHRLELDVRGTQISGQLALHGAMSGTSRWAGTLSTLTLAPEGLPAWKLVHPVAPAYDRGAIDLPDLCLAAGNADLCVDARRQRDGAVSGTYRLHGLPIAMLANATGYADLPVTMEGALDGAGSIERSSGGVLRGDAAITSAAGSITAADRPDEPLLRYDGLTLRAAFAPDDLRLEAHARFDHDGRLDVQASAAGTAQTLHGSVALHLGSLAPIELLTTSVANMAGTLDARFDLAGTLDQPQAHGQALARDVATEVPALGLKLTQGQLSVTTSGSAEAFRIDGSVRSGAGELAVAGTARLGEPAGFALTLAGKGITAVDIPAARVIASPNLTLDQDAQGIRLGGALSIDQADVDVDKLPGGGANEASPDIVIMDAQDGAQAARRLPFSADVKIGLGTKTHLVAMGLDGRVKGTLEVSDQPGRAATGRGQLTVDGTYRAYGQALTIQHGVLSFADTPLANPGLTIRAVRQLNPTATVADGQEVGLDIAGTAERPTLTVFSNPAMDQSDALSYLVTGKPISAVSSGEGDVVNSAAQALGSAAGNLLAKRVGAELGIDDIGITASDALGGNSAFTVGKFLSPRLYLSYGVGLFEPGQVITLRYRLSKRWNLEAQQATEFSRGSLNYRIER